MKGKGLNGAQQQQINMSKFQSWIDELKAGIESDDEQVKEVALDRLAPFIRGQFIKKATVSKELKISRSSFTAIDSELNKMLVEFESFLRSCGYLADLTEEGKKEATGKNPTMRDSSLKKSAKQDRRLASLEVENMQLKTRINELQNGMDNLKELAEVLSELGVVKD